MAIAAGRFARIRGSGVPRDEAIRMVASAPRSRIGPVTLQTIGAHVAAGAARGGCRRFDAVPVGKVGAVTRRCGAGHDGGRAQVGCQRCDRPRRRRAGMTLVAEFACVTGRTGGSQRLARGCAVTPASEKVGRGVRGRRGKLCDVLPRESHGTDQRHMATGARGIGRRQMRGSNAVTIQAALDDGITHRHARLAGQRMAGRTRRRLVLRLRGVVYVIEAKIAAPRRGWCPPHDRLLDRPVMARVARD